MQPHGIDLTLELKVFEHGRGLGMLKVPRQIGEAEFTDRDRILWSGLRLMPPMLWCRPAPTSSWLRATTAG